MSIRASGLLATVGPTRQRPGSLYVADGDLAPDELQSQLEKAEG